MLTARGSDGRLWTAPLRGPVGFLSATGRTLRIAAVPGLGDPLHGLAISQPVGLVAIEFSARRRVRVNGVLVAATPESLEIEVDQAYGNCPQYISRRTFVPDDDHDGVIGATVRDVELSDADRRLIAGADTFFLGTAHPTRGADASHRGGPVGFVHVEGAELSWPDLPGNNMFNSLGNLAADPTAALLVVDWTDGSILELSGTASVEWLDLRASDDGADTGRRVRFTTEAVVRRQDPALRARTT